MSFRRRLFEMAIVVLILVVLGTLVGALLVFEGAYNVSALEQHTAPVHMLLNTMMKRSVRQRAEDVVPVPLSDSARIEKGSRLFRDHCVMCHGAPGVAPGAAGKGMVPLPPNLAETAREQTPAEIHWVIKNGIKMTGMPAWAFRLSDDDIWAVVAFVERLPELSPGEYRGLLRIASRQEVTTEPQSHLGADSASGTEFMGGGRWLGGDPVRGKVAIQQYGCPACHTIPGVVGADKRVGPPLTGIAHRLYIAGIVTNTSEHMLEWLRHPQQLDPMTAMPDLGLTERDARDIASYLYTLR